MLTAGEMAEESLSSYGALLEDALGRLYRGDGDPQLRREARLALDGQPSSELKRTFSTQSRRRIGAFFTPRQLASQLAKPWARDLLDGATVIDPTCGVGDLLVACARYLPVANALDETLDSWGERLRGVDIRPDFVHLTKLRLALVALERSKAAHLEEFNADGLFPNIVVGDALASIHQAAGVTHAVLNPPYFKIKAPVDCEWGSGQVSYAALVVDRCLSEMNAEGRVTAVLPDVLRTGSNYAKWRAKVEDGAYVSYVKSWGRFDNTTDVDVFVLRLRKSRPKSARPAPWVQKSEGPVLASEFCVNVGPVVPHRQKKVGPWRSYVSAGTVRGQKTFDATDAPKLRFAGRTFSPPFVVLRRTSAPGDPRRAVSTLVTGKVPVAVENHLLVLTPKDNRLATCQKAMDILDQQSTDSWLDQRIRCRHLTVQAIRETPWGVIDVDARSS